MSKEGFEQLKEIFLQNDLDNSNELDLGEFRRLIDEALGRGELSQSDVAKLFK